MDQIIEDYFLNILLIILSLQIYQNYSFYLNLKKTLFSVQGKQELDLPTLMNILKQKSKKPSPLPQTFPNIFNPNEIVFANFIVRGFVQRNGIDALFSKNNKKLKTPLTMTISFESKYFQNEEFSLKSDWNFVKKNDVCINMTDFNLVERINRSWFYDDPVVSCKVYKNPDVQWLFKKEDKIFSQKNRKEHEDNRSYFSRLLSFCKSLFYGPGSFVALGIENKEFGLKVGSSLSILGNVIFNPKDKSLRIEKPLYFFESKKILLEYFQKMYGSERKKLILLCFGAFAFVLYKIVQIMNKVGDPMKRCFPGNEIYTNMDENLACPNCKMKTKNIVLLPCKHLSLCEDCYYLLREREKSRCPCCKQKFNDFFKIYVV